MRAFPTHIHNVSPSYSRVSNGASQGSVPGPADFTLYMLPSGKNIWQAGINFNCSADDTLYPCNQRKHSRLVRL